MFAWARGMQFRQPCRKFFAKLRKYLAQTPKIFNKFIFFNFFPNCSSGQAECILDNLGQFFRPKLDKFSLKVLKNSISNFLQNLNIKNAVLTSMLKDFRYESGNFLPKVREKIKF